MPGHDLSGQFFLIMKPPELIPHLFRTEFQKITAVLCNRFGIDIIEFAEDIASETFLAAQESWPYKGLPENPAAWLHTVARHKALNHLRRSKLFRDKVSPTFAAGFTEAVVPDIDWSPGNIRDSQLRMMFAICEPSIPADAQVALALRILCGFGIEEIAAAFLTNKETINKRLSRGKGKLRQANLQFDVLTIVEINQRIEPVLTVLYLIFNEGYQSESNDEVVRSSLCAEAMRLCYQLVELEATNLPIVHALYSLMCFQASRLGARRSREGEIILYRDQDTSLWDRQLISKGGYHLNLAAQGNHLSTYHLEAGIAFWHTIKEESLNKWENILHLFNQLLQIRYSPVAALNRSYALSKVKGNQVAILETEKLGLKDNQYYHALLGELYKEFDPVKSRSYFETALELAKTSTAKDTFRSHIERLTP